MLSYLFILFFDKVCTYFIYDFGVKDPDLIIPSYDDIIRYKDTYAWHDETYLFVPKISESLENSDLNLVYSLWLILVIGLGFLGVCKVFILKLFKNRFIDNKWDLFLLDTNKESFNYGNQVDINNFILKLKLMDIYWFYNVVEPWDDIVLSYMF